MQKPKTKMGRPTRDQKQVKDAQKLSREELESGIRMNKALKYKDAEVLAEFGIDADKVTIKQQMDANKELIRLSTQHLKELEDIGDDDFEKIKNSGVRVATFQRFSTPTAEAEWKKKEAERLAEEAKRKHLRVVNG